MQDDEVQKLNFLCGQEYVKKKLNKIGSGLRIYIFSWAKLFIYIYIYILKIKSKE